MKRLPSSIGNLRSLTRIALINNQLKTLPNSISNLKKLKGIDLSSNQLIRLPINFGNLINTTGIDLTNNQLLKLPKSIGNLKNLEKINISRNKIVKLPKSVRYLRSLTWIGLDGNPLKDISILRYLHKIEDVYLFNTSIFPSISLPRRYWTKLSEWKTKWLLDEDNAEMRRVLIQQIGYERLCQELDAISIDSWREYTLLKIEKVDIEPMVLLKMTCPSTAHIHILRVPPEMINAEAAIIWVNHGIHPDELSVQT